MIREKIITNDIAPFDHSRPTIKMKAFIINALSKKNISKSVKQRNFPMSTSAKSPPESAVTV